VWVICFGALATPAAAQLPNQSFEVVPQVAHATVGDSVTLRFRVRLDQQDLLYDTVPRPTTDLSDRVRILFIEKLRRGPDRAYTGRATVAFFRTGRQAVPVFGLPFMRAVKGLSRAILTSDSAFVEIDPVAPPGNPPLKDIRDIVRIRGYDPRLLAGGIAAAVCVVIVGLLRRHRAAFPPAAPEHPDQPVVSSGPYDRALARLAEIERDGWPTRGEVDRYYAAVVDTLRRYLEEAHGVNAFASTSDELIRALPPNLTRAGPSERCAILLGQADLVKFARVRPDARAAKWFVREARALIEESHGKAE
jgi:hypothetical protein